MSEALLPAGGPAIESDLLRDMLRRGLPYTPILIVAAAAFWGTNGALSAAYGVALVVGNLALSAGLLAIAARISLTVVLATVLIGYFVRLGIVFVAVYLVRDAAWVELVPLGLTIIVTHLGLLAWEMRFVSVSLAFPGVRPDARAGRSSS